VSARAAVCAHPTALATCLRAAAVAQPREACGLLLGRTAGRCGTVTQAVELANRAASDERFELDAREHLATELDAARRGLSVLGTWHSHANGPATPSALDEHGACAYPLAWIVGLEHGEALVRAYDTRERPWRELALRMEPA